MQRLMIEANDIPYIEKQNMKQTPMFLYHGTHDDKLLIDNTELSYEIFKNEIYTGEHQDNYFYTRHDGLEHQLDPAELNKVKNWF